MTKLDIRIKVIPHAEQRYNTVGDYEVLEDETFEIRVSEMDNFRQVLAIAMHELTEFLLCQKDGVTISQIDQFDFAFEELQDPTDMKEPGEDPSAPYHKQHLTASAVERAIIASEGLDWDKHDAEIMLMMAERARSEEAVEK
jgi:hypothetical protein